MSNSYLVLIKFFQILLTSSSILAHHIGQPITKISDFIPFTEAESCFIPKINEPKCTFFKKPHSNPITYDCIQKQNRGNPALRVIGDFHQFKIQCSASYPIDFIYYGIVPNEALFVNWWKDFDKSGEPIVTSSQFVVDVDVYSVQALFDFYNNPNGSLYINHNDGLPYTTKHDYSRTGNYTFPGIFDKEKMEPSFYFILEDGAKPEFLRNNRTFVSVDENKLIVPCVSSHRDVPVELLHPTMGTQVFSNQIEGISISMETGKNYNGDYKCILKYDGAVVDTLVLKYEEGKVFYLPGFLGATVNAGELAISTEKRNYGTHTSIIPECNRLLPDDAFPTNRILISVPMYNFGFMRLRQLFALPEYYKRSYTARATDEYDVLIRKMTLTESPTTQRMLTVYCRYESAVQISDFGSSVTVHIAVNFAFGRDWAKFDRSKSAISTHFILSPLNNGAILYKNSPAKFSCKVNIPVTVSPVVWYTHRKNGTYIMEYVDYNLEDDTSIFNQILSGDADEILCAASYWYTQTFRNISLPLILHNGLKPQIFSSRTEYTFRRKESGRSIKCEAYGEPLPRIYFKHNGFELVGTSKGNHSILDFDINEAIEGTYFCVASNTFGTVQKEIHVYLNDGDGVTITVLIAIAASVFILTIIGAFIYIKYFRKERTGLTKEEIEEFVKGLKEGDLGGNKGDYAHEFAHLVPYTGEYEVPTSRFKIDMTNVLGSGAYGMVLKAVLDDDDVAVKTVKRNADKQYLKALLSELKIMIYLGNHPNLIQVIGAYTKELSKGNVYVFVKYLPLGNLENYLRSQKSYFLGSSSDYTNTIANRLDKNSFGHDDLLRWTTELASGMEYLSSKKVIHGDLAARNLLLDDDRTIRITDFGLSRQLYDYSDYVKKQQEPLPWRWMALESLKYLSFSTSSDVWAFGITVWEIFSLGEVPYPGYSWTLQFVEELENGLRMSRPKYASNLIYVLMTQCWHQASEKRPSFSVLKERFTEILNAEANTMTKDQKH